MKNLIITKKHPSIHLGHLYEHIFCNHVKNYFYEQGLFKYSDFALQGTTYTRGGIIEVDIELYSAKAINCFDKIPRLKARPDENSLYRALMQVIAEEGETLGFITSHKSILHNLQDLDNQSWAIIDELDSYDTKKLPQKSYPVFLEKNSGIRPRHLRLELQLNSNFTASHRPLLPLFGVLSKLIILTCQDRLSHNGYYSGEISQNLRKSGFRASTIFKVVPSFNLQVNLQIDLQICKDVITTVEKKGGFSRLIKDLQSISFAKQSNFAPNIHRILEDTGIYMGAKGWQQIATEKNVQLILKNMSLELAFGRKKALQHGLS